MKRRSTLSSAWIAGALLGLVSAKSAWAQTPAEVAARRGLLSQAEAASQAGNHTEALELGERAGRISMTPSLRYFLANEQNALGRFAESLGNAELCAQTAERDTTLRNRAALITQCRTLTTQLQSRIGHVTLRVPTPPPAGLQITIGGQAVSDAFWGVPFVVTPGHIVVESVATGHAPVRSEVDVTAGGTMDVPVELGAEIAMASSSPPPSEVVASSAPSSPPPAVVPPPPQSAAPFALLGGGAFFLVAGVVSVAVLRPVALNALERDCFHSLTCASTSRGGFDGAAAATIGGAVAIGVGVVAVGVGLGWFFGSRSASRTQGVRSVGVAPLAEGGGMVSIGGAL